MFRMIIIIFAAGMRIKVQIFAGILLLFFAGHMLDASLFPHTHFVDGHIIAHSHPHSDSPDKPGHEHCKSQLVLISLLSTTLMAAATLTTETVLPVYEQKLFVNLRETYIQNPEYCYSSLRGPPATV